jgi:RNA polymerase sigma-70 factor, ECF subfamily
MTLHSASSRAGDAATSPSQGPEAPTAPDSDGRLLERLQAGDERAFEELVREAGGRLLAVARRMLTREEDAHDAVQEAFLSAFKALGSFDGRSRLTTWLHRITVNVCLMKLRSRRRHPEHAIEDLLPDFLADGHHKNPPRSWNVQSTQTLESHEQRDLVRSMIDELPDAYREVLLLRDIEEHDTDQTAEALGITAAAVKTRLHRARQALRTLLDPYFAETACAPGGD